MKAILKLEQVFEIAKMHIDRGDVDGFNDNFMFMTKQMRMMLPGNENTLLTQLITEVSGMYKKNRAEIGIQFFSGYNEAVDDVLSLLKKHKDE